jgi:hypothetical protein
MDNNTTSNPVPENQPGSTPDQNPTNLNNLNNDNNAPIAATPAAPAPQPPQPASPVVDDSSQFGQVVAGQFADPNAPIAGQPQMSSPTPQLGVLAVWPGAFKIYKVSKEVVKFNMGSFLGMVGCYIAIVIVDLIVTNLLHGAFAKLIWEFIYDLAAIIIASALAYVSVKAVRGVKVQPGQAFSYVFSKFFNILIISIITGVIAVVSILLLVVPAFFIIPRIYLSLYYVVDQDLDAGAALKASWNDTRGNLGKIYGIVGVYICIALPSITIIGILATIYFSFFYLAAGAILYAYISNHANVPVPPAPVVSPLPPSLISQ